MDRLLDLAFYAECSLMSVPPLAAFGAPLQAAHSVATWMGRECSCHEHQGPPSPSLLLSHF